MKERNEAFQVLLACLTRVSGSMKSGAGHGFGQNMQACARKCAAVPLPR